MPSLPQCEVEQPVHNQPFLHYLLSAIGAAALAPPFVLLEMMAGHSGAMHVAFPASETCAETVCTYVAFPKEHVAVSSRPCPCTKQAPLTIYNHS